VTRRTVRVDIQFFTELDAQLGETRGPNGEPSATDFLLIDLPTIADAFAERFDEFPRSIPTAMTTATWSRLDASSTPSLWLANCSLTSRSCSSASTSTDSALRVRWTILIRTTHELRRDVEVAGHWT
jgi:hypothetical protein